MKGKISKDRSAINVSANMNTFGLGNCTMVGKSTKLNSKNVSVTSGFDYKKKMFGTAICKENNQSKENEILAFNDLWVENGKDYLTTRYHFGGTSNYYRYNFGCVKGKSCLYKYQSDDFGSVAFQKNRITLIADTKDWGRCEIIVKN